jgi:toxin ParE1/3/4
MKVRFRARALADLEEIGRYLVPRSPTGARNVLRAIQGAIEQVAQNPLGAMQSSDHSIRVKIIGRYRYKIFYSVVDGDAVEIIHVRHTARRPWL